MIVLGMFMTSLCTEYYQFLLAQGFCVGLGMGLVFLPSAAILSQYFLRHRALVLGLASAGSPVAGIVFPVIFSNLEPRIGFGWTTRIMAFIILALSIIPIVFMHTRLPPTAQGRKRAMFDATAFRDVPYVTFAAAGFFSFLTLYVPFFYLVLWAHSHHVSSPEWAPYLVTFLNAGSFFGRIIPNALADRYGALNVMCVCMIASSAIGYAWFAVSNLGGAVVFALLYGAFSGGVVSLTPTVLVGLSPEPSRVGARMGMGFLVTGVSLLIGTPIAGAIVRGYTEPRWQGVKAYSATGLLVSTFLYMLSRWFVYKRRGHWKF
ncbi:major facilitator superfamily domain-containing protein [Podospora conica]|nr:major facilitator superfamily domain-containing protein [Schizothecium conicum]